MRHRAQTDRMRRQHHQQNSMAGGEEPAGESRADRLAPVRSYRGWYERMVDPSDDELDHARHEAGDEETRALDPPYPQGKEGRNGH